MLKTILSLKRNAPVYVLPVLLLFMGTTCFADVVFTDQTFDLTNYSESPLFASSGSTLTFTQCASCGNPGSALQINVSGQPGGMVAQGFINNTFIYDPQTQGALLSAGINAAVNKEVTSNGALSSNTFHPTIEQDGLFYLASTPGPVTTGVFNSISQSGLTASDFQEFDFSTGTFVSGNPNFDGNVMLFGLAQIASAASSNTGVQNTQIIYDNLQFGLTPAVSVPEPSSVTLLIVILGFGTVVRRRLVG